MKIFNIEGQIEQVDFVASTVTIKVSDPKFYVSNDKVVVFQYPSEAENTKILNHDKSDSLFVEKRGDQIVTFIHLVMPDDSMVVYQTLSGQEVLCEFDIMSLVKNHIFFSESGAENDRTVDADQKEIFDFLRQKFVEAIALIDTINYGKQGGAND